MTISTNDQKVDKDRFESNFEDIFGSPKPVKGGSFVQGPDGKMVPRSTLAPTARTAIHIHKDFVSPIDGQNITSTKQLNAHNKKHGVTNSSDYSDGYIARKANARNAAGEKHLKETRHQDVTTMVDRILNR